MSKLSDITNAAAQIVKMHRYKGKLYAPGDDFLDSVHMLWAIAPHRGYAVELEAPVEVGEPLSAPPETD